MSIIEETLRKMQEKHETASPDLDNSGTKAADGNVSENIRPVRTRLFVMIIIVLFVFGLGTYVGFDRYQAKLNEKKEDFKFNQIDLKTVIAPVAKTQRFPATVELKDKLQKLNRHSDAATQRTSVQSPQIPVFENHVSGLINGNIQKKDVISPETTRVVESNQETSATPITNVRKAEPEPKELVVIEDKPQESNRQYDSTMKPAPGSSLPDKQVSESIKENIQKEDVISPEINRVIELNQEASISKSNESESKLELNTDKHSDSVNQQIDNKSSTKTLKSLKHSGEIPTSLLLEKLAVEKQLDQAEHLVNNGSYIEAIEILKPIIDRSAGTWNTYLLMGAAYLGLSELYHAEAYLDMGLAINGKNPQLWLLRAIVEQQKGKHGFALQILHKAQKFVPDMPEVYLNIGYSNDALGSKESSVKAYDTFLKLTEGNQAYTIVRHKVLERLQYLK